MASFFIEFLANLFYTIKCSGVLRKKFFTFKDNLQNHKN